MQVDSGQLTPEMLERRKKLAAALMASGQQGMARSPLEGIGNLANTAAGALAMHNLTKKPPVGA